MPPGPQKGNATRLAILEEAMQQASVRGLEGLSIGTLAKAIGMSKAGLFAHFGSKEELQLAVVEAARTRFVAAVIEPTSATPRGLPRLEALVDAWTTYGRTGVFRGGCFFVSVSTEFDGRPGPVRDQVRSAMQAWSLRLEQAVQEAVDEGHLLPATSPALLAFEIQALTFAANNGFQLLGDDRLFDLACRSIQLRLQALRVPKETA